MMVAVTAAPLGLVEEAHAAAEYDFAGCVFLNHS
jgi:hypothetical protein